MTDSNRRRAATRQARVRAGAFDGRFWERAETNERHERTKYLCRQEVEWEEHVVEAIEVAEEPESPDVEADEWREEAEFRPFDSQIT